jgi:beta-lactamase class A
VLEADSGGRLGVAVVDTAGGAPFGQRLDERFAMCSTFKLLLAGAVLARVDAGKEQLARRIRFGRGDLVPFSPVTKEMIDGDGLSVADLCHAAVTRSDNTAANLLLASLGGPSAITALARGLGDQVTRLDRIEPELNGGKRGDERDTTSPRAMAHCVQALTLGNALQAASRDQLVAWLRANATGDMRLRAGMPAGWRVGDKTGTGDNGTANDVAVIWPPNRAPVIVAVYLTEAQEKKLNATIAAVGRAAVSALGG